MGGTTIEVVKGDTRTLDYRYLFRGFFSSSPSPVYDLFIF